MRGFLAGLSGIPIIWLCIMMADIYLATAKSLGANTFRPKDVMGPYMSAITIGLLIWGAVILGTIEYEKALKEKQDKDNEPR